ncbi:MAG: hypothetical protein AAF628_24575 [Planctomycetota bacterium]
MKPHPDRRAATLAQQALLPAEAWVGPFNAPGKGSEDARVDLKLLQWRTDRLLAERGTAAARARLEELQRPDLRAGTVQDGTARGISVALEEAMSLCPPAADARPNPVWTEEAEVLNAKALRRKKDLLVASAGVRVRFSRKRGLLLVDRARDVHSEGVVCFEDRRDRGTLDGFAPASAERPRLFLPNFLVPTAYAQGPAGAGLLLEGRLGRRPQGYRCRLALEGRADERFLRMTVAVENLQDDHRLRIRFRGLGPEYPIGHAGTPAWEPVLQAGRRFMAATLVRACGVLQVGDTTVAVPAAQCRGWVEHRFALGELDVPADYRGAELETPRSTR